MTSFLAFFSISFIQLTHLRRSWFSAALSAACGAKLMELMFGDQGAWSTAKMYFTVPPNGVAKLTVEVDLGGLDHAQREYFPPVSISVPRNSPIVSLKLCSCLELLGAPPPS